MKNSTGASQNEVGVAFLLLGGSYLVTSLVAGFVSFCYFHHVANVDISVLKFPTQALSPCFSQICDRIKYPTAISILGLASMAVAYVFNGPVPFVGTRLTVGVIYGMNTMAGLGMGFVVVSTFSRSQAAVIRQGYKDDFHTYLLMSGR